MDERTGEFLDISTETTNQNEEEIVSFDDGSFADDFEWPEESPKTKRSKPLQETREKRKIDVEIEAVMAKPKTKKQSKKVQEEAVPAKKRKKSINEVVSGVVRPTEETKNPKNGCSMYILKADLEKGLRANKKVTLWRRVDLSLLQKYDRMEEVSKAGDIRFCSTNEYTGWNKKYEAQFLEVMAKCIGKDFNLVQLLNVEEIEDACE